MLKKMVFERLNSGGVKLGSQETRNAVYDGPLNSLCLELSENERFRRMWGIPLDQRMRRRMPTRRTNEAVMSRRQRAPACSRRWRTWNSCFVSSPTGRSTTFKAGLNKISEFLDRFMVEGNRFPVEGSAEYPARCSSRQSSFFGLCWGAKRSPFSILQSDGRPRSSTTPSCSQRTAPRCAQRGPARREERRAAKTSPSVDPDEPWATSSGRRTNFKDTQDWNRCVGDAFATAIAKTKKLLIATESACAFDVGRAYEGAGRAAVTCGVDHAGQPRSSRRASGLRWCASMCRFAVASTTRRSPSRCTPRLRSSSRG